MRSLLSLGIGKEIARPVALSGGRPEILRRRIAGTAARVITAAGALALPFSLYMLVGRGVLVPFIVAMAGLLTGIMSLALHQREQYDRAVATQIYGMAAIGLLAAITRAPFLDFGIATALMAPIYAAMLAHGGLRKWSWAFVAVTAAASAIVAMQFVTLPAFMDSGYAGIGAFIVSGVLVGYAATRLGAAFEVQDTSKLNTYRHLVEHVQDAVMRFGEDGEVLFTSQSAERLFGCRRYELSRGGLGERIHVLDRPVYLTAFADANRDGKARTIEVRMRKDDLEGSTRAPQFIWVEVAFSPVIENSEGLRHEVVALYRDITGRKDDEDVMKAARQAAEDASNAKSRFLATIGHELRTPLNAIVGFSEMMSTGIGGELSPTHKEYAELIHQSGHHLLDVVKMLLDMSKIEAGKFELQTDAFAPDDLVAPSLQMVGSLTKARNITIRTEIAPKMPLLTADERACRQIVINLLSNAIKFSHDYGVVTLSMKRQGENINISVRDNGIGMAPESIRRLGEPFFQVQDGLARQYEGTGLGLSIVKGLVDLHEGRMHAVSELGVGTTMTVLLPVNGPAIKLPETASVTPIRRDTSAQQTSVWQDERKRRA